MPGLALSAFLNARAAPIAFVNAGLLIVYARYSKTMGLLANILIAWMTASVFIFSGAILGRIDLNVIVLASSAFFVMLSREILKDIEDIEGDGRAGARTLPITYGIRRARTVSSVLIFPAILLIYLPLWLKAMDGLYAALIILATAVLVLSFFSEPPRAQKAIKLAALIVLAAFLAGTF